MSLLKCFECGTEVSEYADKCPKCGCPITVIKTHWTKNTNNDNSSNTIYHNKNYYLGGVEELLKDNKIMEATKVIHDELNIEPLEARTLVQVIQFNNNQIPFDLDQTMKEFLEHNAAERDAKAVHCKYCGSTNVKKLKDNFFNLGNQWHCNNCGSDF